MVGPTGKATYDEITRRLRIRICKHENTEALILKEAQIAEEYSVSRTPVRQVLQRLTHERMVETRPGVGTITTKIDLARKEEYVDVLGQLFRVAATRCVHPLPITVKATMNAVLVVTEEAIAGTLPEDEGLSLILESTAQLCDAYLSVVEDPILVMSLSAAYWRVARVRVADVRGDSVFTWDRFAKLIKASLEGAAIDERGAMMLAAANHMKRTTELMRIERYEAGA